MKFSPTPLDGAYIIEPEPFVDKRGLFARIFCKEELKALNLKKDIVQVNHSRTIAKGAIRGLHYQKPPRAETKIVKCIRGSVFDVIVDLRKGSATFLKWYGEILSERNLKTMYVPECFAHGFQVLEAESELLYFHTEVYSPEYESSIRYDDPMINIDWRLTIGEVSEKDLTHPLLTNAFVGL